MKSYYERVLHENMHEILITDLKLETFLIKYDAFMLIKIGGHN